MSKQFKVTVKDTDTLQSLIENNPSIENASDAVNQLIEVYRLMMETETNPNPVAAFSNMAARGVQQPQPQLQPSAVTQAPIAPGNDQLMVEAMAPAVISEPEVIERPLDDVNSDPFDVDEF